MGAGQWGDDNAPPSLRSDGISVGDGEWARLAEPERRPGVANSSRVRPVDLGIVAA